MCCQSASRRWQLCPGCGHERRLASGRGVMRDHNRWDSAAWAMVRCEGSGQPRRSPDHASAAAARVPAALGNPAPGDGRAA